MTLVHGTCDARFGAVGDVFVDNLDNGDLGAACAVTVDSRPVVDLWGGWADIGKQRPWARDTVVNAYSVGKPLIALSVLQLVGSGEIDLDERADTYWPELRAGQLGATVRDVLCHRAGVPAIRRPLTNDDLWDWSTIVDAVAETEPWWTPGERHAYHTNTYGFLAGELARRATGKRPGAWLRDHLAGPLGADVMWGVPTSELGRCAEVDWNGPTDMRVDWAEAERMTDEQRMILLGNINPPGFSSMGVVNDARWRQTEVPSTNLHATARGLARIYSALAAGGTVDGVQIVDAGVLTEATRTQSEGWCPVLAREVSFGLGFQPTRPDRPFGPNAGSFGHFGTGGSVAFADPGAGAAFGYVINAVTPRWQNARNRALVDALYSCL